MGIHQYHACLRTIVLATAFSWCLEVSLFAQPVTAPALSRPSISTSRQFIVYSSDGNLRSLAAGLAEESKEVWLEVIGPPDQWQMPIYVYFPEEVRRRPRQPFQISIVEGDGSAIRLELVFWDRQILKNPVFPAAILQALAIEFAARTQPPRAGQTMQFAPLWLTEAMVQEVLGKKQPMPGQLLEGVMSGARPPTVAGLFRQRNLPGSVTEQTTFRLLSLALLKTLLNSPEGRQGFRQFCAHPENFDTGAEAIFQSFPSFEGQMQTLERQWALTIARMSFTSRARLLSFVETRRELARILDLQTESAPGRDDSIPLTGADAFMPLARSQGGPRLMMGVVGQLMQLELRSHPLYQPLIREYREIAHNLARRPRSNQRRRVEATNELVESAERFADRIEDAMNVYEVNRAGASDPQFGQMLRLQDEVFQEAPRRDALSLALDAAEARFQR